MNRITKHLFYFLFLFVIASALGSSQSLKNAATQNSAPQSAQTSAVNLMGQVDPSGVMFSSNDQVSQSFAKGVPIYNGNPERNYHV